LCESEISQQWRVSNGECRKALCVVALRDCPALELTQNGLYGDVNDFLYSTFNEEVVVNKYRVSPTRFHLPNVWDGVHVSHFCPFIQRETFDLSFRWCGTFLAYLCSIYV
jgi:hypothetical protein